MQHVFDVRDCGATGDGVTLDTAALQRAVDAAAERGGRVVVPPGTYLTGTLVLKSRVTLDLGQGATLLGSPDLAHYSPRVWGHHKDITPWHLLLAEGAERVVVTGEGGIDGQGPAFWEPDRPHEWHFWRERVRRVSPMVEFKRCRHVRIENVTLRESAGWTLHLHDCDHAVVQAVTIRNSFFGPNTDGIDVTGCRNVVITGCDIATGDDAIALKTTRYSRSCEWVAISDCVLRTSCVGVRVGAESHKPLRNVAVSNCLVPRCSRVVDLRTLEGGDIEHVVVSGVVATTNSGWPVNRPVELSAHRVENIWDASRPPEHQDRGKFDAVPKAGRIRDVTLRDVDIVTDGRVTMVADDDAWLGDVLVDNLRLRYVLLEETAGVAHSAAFIPGPHADARGASAALVAKNVRNLRVRNLAVFWPEYPVPGDWLVLGTPNTAYNRPFYEGGEEEIRAGRHRGRFHVFWGRKLSGGRVELAGLTGSEGGPPADLAGSSVELA